MAKATNWTVTDGEARKRGEQTGLDTLVTSLLCESWSGPAKERPSVRDQFLLW